MNKNDVFLKIAASLHVNLITLKEIQTEVIKMACQEQNLPFDEILKIVDEINKEQGV